MDRKELHGYVHVQNRFLDFHNCGLSTFYLTIKMIHCAYTNFTYGRQQFVPLEIIIHDTMQHMSS